MLDLDMSDILLAKDRRKYNKLAFYFPDFGHLRRELYAKHLEFFAQGAVHRERLFMAANRVGKTESAGGYELALHLTGQYPSWWKGKQFGNSIQAWASGDTAKTTRDILQAKLLGPVHDLGSGLIPKDCIAGTSRKAGVPDAFETVLVRNIWGGVSTLSLKSYDQGRRSFQGTEQDVIWLDEECPMDIYNECVIRTMTTNGIVMITFTPLLGLTPLVLSFLPEYAPNE